MARTVAIMQPYFFPHLGYFQLIAAADLFVVHDDVQYIKAGWVNRNRVLRNGVPVWLTMPVEQRSHDEVIASKRLHEPRRFQRTCLRRIGEYYRGAAFYRRTMELLAPLFGESNAGIADFNIRALHTIAHAIGIATPFRIASQTPAYGREVGGEIRVIRICQIEGASHYVNPSGARSIGLYDGDRFRQAGLRLSYLQPDPAISYSQGDHAFVPSLSIIDVLMHNSFDRIGELLAMYALEPA
jgi:hypothetical protein